MSTTDQNDDQFTVQEDKEVTAPDGSKVQLKAGQKIPKRDAVAFGLTTPSEAIETKPETAEADG